MSIWLKNRFLSQDLYFGPKQSELEGFEFRIINNDRIEVVKAGKLICDTDGETYLNKVNLGRLDFIKDPNGWANQYMFIKGDKVIFKIDTLARGFGNRLLHQDTVIVDNKNNTSIRIRFNALRIFLPIKMELFSENFFDTEVSLSLLAFIWMRKRNTAHDTLG
jgi:hypothetical protein